MGALASVMATAIASVAVQAQDNHGYAINIWWPTNNAVINGVQPFKADISGLSVERYRMFWQVDNGQWNLMPSDYSYYPHKEASVDLSGWHWRDGGPYAVKYIATDLSGREITEAVANIYTAQPSPVSSPQISTGGVQSQPATVTSPLIASSAVAPSGMKLFVDPDNSARVQADAWRASRPEDAARMDRIAAQPTAKWLGGWNADVENDTRAYVDKAKLAGALPVLVTYNVPQRDCGGYSAGGSASATGYGIWIRAVARGIGGKPAIVVLEPDALAGMDCLGGNDRQAREDMLKDAIAVLKQQSAKVYVDAGNPRWQGTDEMAKRLAAAGAQAADGFSLNVSNFFTTDENLVYGAQLSQKLNGMHYIIDTGRNGAGPTADAQWCNPSGRALGMVPTLTTGQAIVDAYLWVKTPGESDGNCNGAPAAGVWWPEYALGLAKQAGW